MSVTVDQTRRDNVTIEIESDRLLTAQLGQLGLGSSEINSPGSAEDCRISNQPEWPLTDLWIAGNQDPYVTK
jgi:hypothetical protein